MLQTYELGNEGRNVRAFVVLVRCFLCLFFVYVLLVYATMLLSVPS